MGGRGSGAEIGGGVEPMGAALGEEWAGARREEDFDAEFCGRRREVDRFLRRGRIADRLHPKEPRCAGYHGAAAGFGDRPSETRHEATSCIRLRRSL